MRKVKKYYYNTSTHRFEKLIVPLRTKLLRVLGFLSSSLVSALIIVAVAFQFLDSPKEKKMRAEMQQMTEQYALLKKETAALGETLSELESRDNEIYRGIFESEPLPDSIRYGKDYSKIDVNKFAYLDSDELTATVEKELDALKNRVKMQQRSYDTLMMLIRAKEKMLASIPAIQPISNKDLSRVASGFGYRIDPIYKTPKMHTGLDFTAAVGTPVYATADGTVSTVDHYDAGYGNHIIINHGYGYETLYGHMSRIKVKRGERVKRGQIIGWVGSTGKSTGPHCHYEVIRKGQKTDPVHFFFNDLSATDYERLVKIAAANNQSFD